MYEICLVLTKGVLIHAKPIQIFQTMYSKILILI